MRLVIGKQYWIKRNLSAREAAQMSGIHPVHIRDIKEGRTRLFYAGGRSGFGPKDSDYGFHEINSAGQIVSGGIDNKWWLDPNSLTDMAWCIFAEEP